MLTFSILFTCNEDDENTDERDSSNNVVHHQRKATIHPKFGKRIEKKEKLQLHTSNHINYKIDAFFMFTKSRETN